MTIKIKEVPCQYWTKNAESIRGLALWDDFETDLEDQEKYPVQSITIDVTAGDVVSMVVNRYDPDGDPYDPDGMTFSENYILDRFEGDFVIHARRGMECGNARPRGMTQEEIKKRLESQRKEDERIKRDGKHQGMFICGPVRIPELWEEKDRPATEEEIRKVQEQLANTENDPDMVFGLGEKGFEILPIDIRDHIASAQKRGFCRQCIRPWEDGLCTCNNGDSVEADRISKMYFEANKEKNNDKENT